MLRVSLAEAVACTPSSLPAFTEEGATSAQKSDIRNTGLLVSREPPSPQSPPPSRVVSASGCAFDASHFCVRHRHCGASTLIPLLPPRERASADQSHVRAYSVCFSRRAFVTSHHTTAAHHVPVHWEQTLRDGIDTRPYSATALPFFWSGRVRGTACVAFDRFTHLPPPHSAVRHCFGFCLSGADSLVCHQPYSRAGYLTACLV